MVDIETMGTGRNARIIQIGAVGFAFNEGVLEPHEIMQAEDRCFNVAIAPYAGAEQDAGAMAFWAMPEQKLAREEIARMPQLTVEIALQRFSDFVARWLGVRGNMWAKPPSFDLSIIEDTYRLVGMPIPYKYNRTRDLRTLISIAKQVPMTGFKVPSNAEARLIPHFALHDAVEQAVVCQAAFRSLTQFSRGRDQRARAMIEASTQSENLDAEPF